MNWTKIFSARFLMATLTTVLACFLVGFIVWTLNDATREKVALIIITGFMTTWSSIVTFYFTRQDREKGAGQQNHKENV